MFKKPLAELKTSAPLRASDRRKLRRRVLQSYPNLPPEEGDALVPDGLQCQKFGTYIDEPGVAYFSPDGDPLWFTIGKGSEDLIPTVYTLWKRPDLLPILSTPSPVVPKLIGGADLMIPGVIQHPLALVPNQLVSVTQYHCDSVGPPLAVGRMAVSSDTLRSAGRIDVKGKAVLIVHTWKDALWNMGSGKKADLPAPINQILADTDLAEEGYDVSAEPAREGAHDDQPPVSENVTAVADESGESKATPLTPEDVSACLRAAVLHTIGLTFADVPSSTFPMPASTFWSSYVLPARPADTFGTRSDASLIDVKHSTHKNVKSFLKACAKEGLIKIKEHKGDIVVTAVFPKHPAVLAKRPHSTIGDIEARAKRDEDKEQNANEEHKKSEIYVCELWKPFRSSVPFFVAAGKDTSVLYTIADIKEIVTSYISSHSLVNANDQQYINVGADQSLAEAVAVKGNDTPFMKRDEVLRRIRTHMQIWHEVSVDGSDMIRKKGEFKPVSIVVKLRQGRKACTYVTGYEVFGLQAEDIADELRKKCASSTSISPIDGRPNSLEVMVQGKQSIAVTDLLISRGVPKQWIEGAKFPKKK